MQTNTLTTSYKTLILGYKGKFMLKIIEKIHVGYETL